jgi:hypothetical protein
MTSKKLVIYSVLTGSRESLGDPLIDIREKETDLEIDFIMFTDDVSASSSTWQIRILEDRALPAVNLCKRPKCMPWDYLSDYDHSLYIDNIVRFRRLPTSEDLLFSGDGLKLYKHHGRSSLFEEALAIGVLGYDESEVLCSQVSTYRRNIPLSEIKPLSTTTIIYRTHGHPKVRSHGTMWWEHILKYSKRDQMSFDYTRLSSSLNIDYFNGTKADNDLVYPQKNMDPQRVPVNFDEVSYARYAKIDASNSLELRRHFLRNQHSIENRQIFFKAPRYLLLLSKLYLSKSVVSKYLEQGGLDKLEILLRSAFLVSGGGQVGVFINNSLAERDSISSLIYAYGAYSKQKVYVNPFSGSESSEYFNNYDVLVFIGWSIATGFIRATCISQVKLSAIGILAYSIKFEGLENFLSSWTPKRPEGTSMEVLELSYTPSGELDNGYLVSAMLKSPSID